MRVDFLCIGVLSSLFLGPNACLFVDVEPGTCMRWQRGCVDLLHSAHVIFT
jgi:hypothetical protein